jgi:hypothetical protein
MKKTILFFIAILFGVSMAGQEGDGLTPGTAYYGTITNAQSWTLAYSGGTIYVGQTGNEDLTIDTGGSLSIEAGVTVKFCTTSSDLIITGTGSLTANGTSLNKITFTRNYPTINSWGHISFQSMGSAGASSLQYCIIEYGWKDGALNSLESVGGGLQTDFNSITISKCIFRYNYAFFGGSIFVNTNRSPSIDNCVFLGNTAREAGGAIYLYNGSASQITNCIFDSNNANGTLATYYSGGAIQFGSSITNAEIINCTFVNNTSAHSGNAIYTLSGGIAVNSIFWGSSNQIDFYSTSGTIDHSAIQGFVSGSHYTNCFELNSSNTGTPQLPGPNFNATDGSDWSIKFDSPCRDAGTISGAPSTDILGHYRVELPDIGAYEVQYSYWTGSINTSWNTQTNWEASIDPISGTGDVVIPFLSGATPNYPIGTPVPDFTIGTGKTMILRPGAEATMGSLTNDGTLRLEEDVTGISSLIVNSYSGNSADIQLFLPGGGLYPDYVWHYISSPFTALSTDVFSVTTKDLARYDENLITTDQNNGWEAYDGYIYSTGLITGTGFSNLDVGKGYNHYLSINHTYTISGIFNSSDVPVALAYNSINSTPDYPDSQGFNLLGNPFPSCLDWSQIAGASGFDPAIGQAIYFNKSGGFATWNNGVGTNGGTGTIPPMQGFFVKTSKAASLTLPLSARMHVATQTRYKKGLEIIPLVRLKIEDQLYSDDAVVRFDDKATTGVDNAFDAYKFSKTGGSVDIWTTTGGADLSINGLPFPDSSAVIPVSVYSTVAGNLKISAPQIDGLDNYGVTLTDNVNNITINLKKTPGLLFNAPGGTIPGRFVLKVGTNETAIPETTISNKPFNIYSSNGTVNIQTLADTWNGKLGGIRILDMTGRVFTTEDNVVFSKDELYQIPVRAATGIYMVEIRSGVMRYVGKVIIR